MDASQVYGENVCVFRDLRGYGGRMNSTAHPRRGKELLPRSPVHPECRAASGYCFIAGKIIIKSILYGIHPMYNTVADFLLS